MLYFWNPDDLLIPNMMVDTSPWSSCSRWLPWLPCSGHTFSSTGPSVSPFRDFFNPSLRNQESVSGLLTSVSLWESQVATQYQFVKDLQISCCDHHPWVLLAETLWEFRQFFPGEIMGENCSGKSLEITGRPRDYLGAGNSLHQINMYLKSLYLF